MNDSWCDMHDDILDVTSATKKEVLNVSNITDSIGIERKSPTLKNKKNIQLGNDENRHMTFAEIMQLNIDKSEISETKILYYQIYVTNQLKTYVTQCIEKTELFDVELHLPKIEWLALISQQLSKKKSLREIKFKKETNFIQRNSYEFCKFGKKCINKNGKCKKKHIVHNYVLCDLLELIRHLKNEPNVSQKDILTSINTINYVLNHMQDELSNENLIESNDLKNI